MPTKYHDQLSALEHYRKYPSMLPYIGSAYESTSHKKLLLCGESHYLPKESSAHIEHEKWYAGKESDLSKKEISYIHTADTLTYSGHRMFAKFGSIRPPQFGTIRPPRFGLIRPPRFGGIRPPRFG